jgi:gamma-glutamyltranspeptidase / glutathione hydrolase
MNVDWGNPYPSQRSPVFAANVVATSQPLATQAGIAALRNGGNAVDAALASAIALTVVEPNNNGIGSDAFALIWDGGSLHGLNASGRSPKALDISRFADQVTMPVLGWDAVTVPGAVSAWVEMSRRFGKLPFPRLFDEAIRYARDGFQVGPITGRYWQGAATTFNAFDAFMDTFMVDGKAPPIGSLMQLPDHARSLQLIAESNGEAFYRGDLARAIAQDAARHDCAFSYEDLVDHSCEWVEPIAARWQDQQLHEIPPNGQGLMALIGLGILNHLDVTQYPVDSADSVHLQIEAIRIAYAEIERHLADINYMKVTPADLLDQEYLRGHAERIQLSTSNRTPTTLGAGSDTVYLTAADANGMMVSMIQSNYRGFGSGIVVPGTGVSLQNRGSGFVLEEGHPNQVGPGKKPFHTIIPGFVTENGMPRMSFGVMGGHMQAQGHLQMMVRVFGHGQNPQAASDAPRWQVKENGELALEKGFSTEVAEDLRARGHDVLISQPDYLFGGAQLILRMDDGYCAASDHRKEGHAAGY